MPVAVGVAVGAVGAAIQPSWRAYWFFCLVMGGVLAVLGPIRYRYPRFRLGRVPEETARGRRIDLAFCLVFGAVYLVGGAVGLARGSGTGLLYLLLAPVVATIAGGLLLQRREKRREPAL